MFQHDFFCRPVLFTCGIFEKKGSTGVVLKKINQGKIKIVEKQDLNQILELQYRAFYGQALIYIENLYSNTVKKYRLFTGHKSDRNLHLYKKLGYKESKTEWLAEDYALVYMEKYNY